MRKKIMTSWVGLAFVASCTDNNTVDTWVPIAGDNSLGVAALHIASYQDDDGRVFEIRGMSADNDQVGLVRSRIGTIEGLKKQLPGDDEIGAEITTWVEGRGGRTYTRETNEIHLEPFENSVRDFLALPEVADALTAEHVTVVTKGGPGETGYSSTCPGWALNTSPTAQQCCYGLAYPGGWPETMFVNGSTGNIAYRFSNPNYLTCRAYNYGSCSGNACYWGPFGWSRANVYAPAGPYVKIVNAYPCDQQDFESPQTPDFGDVNGDNPTGQTCPGGGGTAEWDY